MIALGQTARARELALVQKHGEAGYLRLKALEEARLSRVRLDWRFYAGLGMALAGTALLVFKPDVRAARGRAKGRLTGVGKPGGGKGAAAVGRARKRLGAAFKRARRKVKG